MCNRFPRLSLRKHIRDHHLDIILLTIHKCAQDSAYFTDLPLDLCISSHSWLNWFSKALDGMMPLSSHSYFFFLFSKAMSAHDDEPVTLASRSNWLFINHSCQFHFAIILVQSPKWNIPAFQNFSGTFLKKVSEKYKLYKWVKK